jgi:hypothetical protein
MDWGLHTVHEGPCCHPQIHGNLASEKSLMVWVKSRWKVKGEMDLKLGSKGFFTVIFPCTGNKDKIFDEGPYFFNSVGLHLRYWMEGFSPKKEDYTSLGMD